MLECLESIVINGCKFKKGEVYQIRYQYTDNILVYHHQNVFGYVKLENDNLNYFKVIG